MPDQVKWSYLEFIYLVWKYRRRTPGFKGLLYIPIKEIEKIKDSYPPTDVQRLIDDNFLESLSVSQLQYLGVRKKKTEGNVDFVIKTNSQGKCLVIFCKKTSEEIRESFIKFYDKEDDPVGKKKLRDAFREIIGAEINNKIKLPDKLPAKIKVEFDQQTKILKYGSKKYRIQRSKGRAEIFATLWNNRKIIKNDKIKSKGSLVSYIKIAQIVGWKYKILTYEDYKKEKCGEDHLLQAELMKCFYIEQKSWKGTNNLTERKIYDVIGDFKGKIKEMKAPIRFDCNEGYMMIVQE
ncbi:MAG: hypothetical protein PHG83_02470 [Patescibacteria group bacterium]|nr:hypothetical protein [Patescibacteria group bacterium]